jgi:hypothetical protein
LNRSRVQQQQQQQQSYNLQTSFHACLLSFLKHELFFSFRRLPGPFGGGRPRAEVDAPGKWPVRPANGSDWAAGSGANGFGGSGVSVGPRLPPVGRPNPPQPQPHRKDRRRRDEKGEGRTMVQPEWNSRP